MLTREKGVDIVVCDMPLLDTRKGKDLLGTFISDMIIQLLSFCTDIERRAIKKRQEEGIAAAKLRGVTFGRPESDLPDDFGDLVDRWRRREITLAQALALSCMSKSSFYHKAAAYPGKSLMKGPNRSQFPTL